MDNNVKPAIISFPGSNCEQDMARVLTEVFRLDPSFIWHMETVISDDITHVIIPGGFSFGDYLRAGTLAAFSPIMDGIKKFAELKKPILGVCNGFQILCEAQLLPGVLLRNSHDRFVCEVVPTTWWGLNNRSAKPLMLNLPIAHREGRYFADHETLTNLKNNQQIILAYNDTNDDGNACVNGSTWSIAGIIGGPNNNIIGMMPHPERRAIHSPHGHDGRLILEEFFKISQCKNDVQSLTM